MVADRGLLMELGEVQNKLDVKQRQFVVMGAELKRLRRENQSCSRSGPGGIARPPVRRPGLNPDIARLIPPCLCLEDSVHLAPYASRDSRVGFKVVDRVGMFLPSFERDPHMRFPRGCQHHHRQVQTDETFQASADPRRHVGDQIAVRVKPEGDSRIRL